MVRKKDVEDNDAGLTDGGLRGSRGLNVLRGRLLGPASAPRSAGGRYGRIVLQSMAWKDAKEEKVYERGWEWSEVMSEPVKPVTP